MGNDRLGYEQLKTTSSRSL